MFVAATPPVPASAPTSDRGLRPTPALAFLAGTGDFAAGDHGLCPHNPADDLGSRCSTSTPELDDSVETSRSSRSDRLGSVGTPRSAVRRTVAAERREHRLGLARSVDARGLRIVLDCVNGSGGIVAPEILAATGADVEAIHNDPTANIVEAGATSPGSLAAAVRERGANVGFALDGDADRLIAVDADGRVVDGDQVLGILALERLGRDALPEKALVVSVLSNGGLQAAVEASGGQVIRTPVGDKYILEGMQVARAGLGGEKSGHVIILEHTTSGDGIVTALEVLRVMAARSAGLAELAAEIPMLPQQQRAVPARHKDQWEATRHPAGDRDAGPAGDGGRVLVCPSGTVSRCGDGEGPDADW
jgi:phosphoglucosamine mutase